MRTDSKIIAAKSTKATVVRWPTPCFSAMTPIVKFISMFPTRAMVSTMLNAVPEADAYRLPTNPSITGKPEARPTPMDISPATAMIGGADHMYTGEEAQVAAVLAGWIARSVK